MEAMFVALSLNIAVKRRNLATGGFFTVSMIPADLHPDKTMLFPFWSISRILAKLMDLRSRKSTRHFINDPEINVKKMKAT